MFSKYVSKITNTIGTVNYLQQKSKKRSEKQYTHWRNSSKQKFFDEGLDVDVDTETNNNNNNYQINQNQILNHCSSNDSQTILTTAIAKLRNTLLLYELVFHFSYKFIVNSSVLFCFFFNSFCRNLFFAHFDFNFREKKCSSNNNPSKLNDCLK